VNGKPVGVQSFSFEMPKPVGVQSFSFGMPKPEGLDSNFNTNNLGTIG